ncbi:MAG TPA: dihydroneopterin aldolase [Sedimentisphaerales bacterium]|nr:dihydroneopterin aldolase [Phycisphaerae bacterium]HON92348.1 dihydroneopterin aldolase [Sedimentisphaerales bacterium]HOV76496.1 dihydroneopterin aldolase [Sedimentisphaerales bacterium]
MTDAATTASSDRIFIRDLLVRCILGVEDAERREKQEVVVQVELWADLRKAGRTDALADSIDYSVLKRRILQATENTQYRLIEALAQQIADECLKDQRIECVKVTVEKRGVLRFARSVGVEILRRRGPVGG